MLAFELAELVPDGLLVGEVDAPLDVLQGAVIAAAVDGIADVERPAVGTLIVIDVDLEARGGAFDAAPGVLEFPDRKLGGAVGREQRIAVFVTVGGQSAGLFRRNVELIRTVSQARNAYAGVNAVDGYTFRGVGHNVSHSVEEVQRNAFQP